MRTSCNPCAPRPEEGTQDETLKQEKYHDLDLFVTVQILDDTPAVLSLGKLCEERRFSYEWASGQKPHLTMEEDSMQDGQCRASCCPWIVVKL